ncbi:hypothetical protein [Peribacillus asahii]|uniref:hypothetical protein n=1 Tax=Peribacillus asahii TaxID=228899 RepID=UPI0037FB94AB
MAVYAYNIQGMMVVVGVVKSVGMTGFVADLRIEDWLFFGVFLCVARVRTRHGVRDR